MRVNIWSFGCVVMTLNSCLDTSHHWPRHPFKDVRVVAGSLQQCNGEAPLHCQKELHTQGFSGALTSKYPEGWNLASTICVSGNILYSSTGAPSGSGPQWFWQISVEVSCKPMWQNIRAYKTVIKNPYAQINEVLLGSRFCPLLLFVNIDDEVSTDMCLSCKEHLLMNQVLS
jgi:hypothetical protein